jgi:hypothetical protein
MSADAMTPIERAVARDEIRQLACRYALAVDSRDMDLLCALFVPDVRVGPYGEGRDALRRSMEESLSAIGVSILLVGNHVIDFESESRARGIVYCQAQIEDDIASGGTWIEQAIQYRDTYERRDGEWLFVRRKHVLWYGTVMPSSPLDQPAANWPESQVGRGTVPEDMPSWNAFWKGRR